MSSVVSSKITGKEYPLSKIFSSDFEYHIPGYQRPYAWTEDETGALFDDLYGFFQTENTENFFLGSIVLIKDEQNRYADVIDGQQRLTTLSILFAVLADTFDNEDYKMDCKKYLQEKGNVLEGIEAQPRLFLKEKTSRFSISTSRIFSWTHWGSWIRRCWTPRQSCISRKTALCFERVLLKCSAMTMIG